jgi:acyl carrier protein
MSEEKIGTTVSEFIAKNFLFDKNKKVEEYTSLLGSGVLDSTGVLELIAFLETTFSLKFKDEELVAENFDSVEKIKSFIARKLNQN